MRELAKELPPWVKRPLARLLGELELDLQGAPSPAHPQGYQVNSISLKASKQIILEGLGEISSRPPSQDISLPGPDVSSSCAFYCPESFSKKLCTGLGCCCHRSPASEALVLLLAERCHLFVSIPCHLDQTVPELFLGIA